MIPPVALGQENKNVKEKPSKFVRLDMKALVGEFFSGYLSRFCSFNGVVGPRV